MERSITVSRAEPRHTPGIVAILRQVAEHNGHGDLYDEDYAWSHITQLICSGVSFFAEEDNDIIGVAMCQFVDFGYVLTEHLELWYLYVVPAKRRSRAAVKLLQALEDYADANGIVVIFHQLDYPDAINGMANNSERVERLFQFRNYDGPIDLAYVRQSNKRVGISYQYDGRRNANPEKPRAID